MPALVWNSTCRFSTASSGPSSSPPTAGDTSIAFLFMIPPFLSELRVERVADGVADHDKGEHRDAQEDRGEEQRLRRHQEPVPPVRDHQAPGDAGGLDTDAEEGQGRLGGDEDA